MAKKADANRGRIEVEFVADANQLASVLQTQEVQASGRDATPVSERPGKGGRSKQDVQVEATADVKVNKTKIAKQVQDAILDADNEIQLVIDTGDIAAQIQRMFEQRVFKINLQAENMDISAAQMANVGTQHPSMTQHGAPVSRGAPPKELIAEMFQKKDGQTIARPFRDAIDNLYRNLNNALNSAGKGSFGTHSTDPGNQVEKLGELMEAFGDDIHGWIETKGPVNKPTGGGSIMEFLKSQGVDLGSEQVKPMVTAFGSLSTGEQRRSAEMFAKHVSNWWRLHPPIPQPAAAVERPGPAPAAPEVAPTVAAAIEKFEEATKANRQAVIEERQRGLSFNPIEAPPETGRVRGRVRGDVRSREQFDDAGQIDQFPVRDRVGPTDLNETRDDEANAQSRARRGLGGDRANVRRLRGAGPTFSGIDTEAYLRRGEMGGFENVYEQFTGDKFSESQGFGQITANTPEGEDELRRMGKLSPHTKRAISGQEGKFNRLLPVEALARTIQKEEGFEGDTNFLDQLMDVLRGNEDVSKALEQGRRPAAGGVRETKRGQGATSYAGTGTSFPRPGGEIDDVTRAEIDHKSAMSSYAEASKKWDQLTQDRRMLMEQRKDLRRKIDDAHQYEDEWGEGGPEAEEQAYERMQKLGAADEALTGEIARNSQQRKELRAAEPGLNRARREERRGMKTPEQRAETNRRSQESVARGVGYSEAELQQRELQSPERQGSMAAYLMTTLGLGNEQMTPTEMVQQALKQRYRESRDRIGDRDFEKVDDEWVETEASKRGEGRSSLTGAQKMREVAYGPTRKARRDVNPGEDAGVYGELLSAIPDTLARSSKTTLTQALKDLMSSALENDKFIRDEVEAEIAKKEGATTRRPIGGKTTASAIVTDAGIERVAFDRPVTGEGEFLNAPGLAGRREALLERNRELKASAVEQGTTPEKLLARRTGGKESEFPYFDPDSDEGRASIENLLIEREQKDRTRLETLGKGKYQSAADTDKIAQSMGLGEAPDEAPPGLPFASFAQKYGGGGTGAGGGTPPGGDGGSGGGWPEMTGPIHVIVDNIPLQVAFAGTYATGSGQGARRPRDEQPDVQSFEPGAEPEYVRQGDQAAKAASAVEAAMERDFIAALQAVNKPKRRKNIKDRAVGTEVDQGRIYSYPPDEEPEARRFYPTGAEPAQSMGEKRLLAAIDSQINPDRIQADVRRQEAAQRRAAQFARVANPEGLAQERDVGDDELSPIRANLRSIQRRVPRRGFGASLTDLITSGIGGNAFESQLESAGRAEREASELQTLFGQRSTMRTDLGALQQQRRQIPGPQRGPINERIISLTRQLDGLDKAIDLSKEKFFENAKAAGSASAVMKSFGAAAVGSIGSIGIGALTFGLGSAVAAPIIEGVGMAMQAGLERLFGDPQLISAMRTGLGEATRAAQGRGEEGFAQVAVTSGLSGETFTQMRERLSREAEVEAGNRAITEQISILKLGESNRSGVTQGTGGFLDTGLFGQPSTQEQIGEFLFQPNVSRKDASAPLSGFRAPWDDSQRGPGGMGGDFLVGDLETLHSRMTQVNQLLDKNNKNLAMIVEGTGFTAEELDKQAEELRFQGAPNLAKGPDAGRTAFINKETGRLLSGEEIIKAFEGGAAEAAKPSVAALLELTANQRQARIEQQDALRSMSLGVTGPQTGAIALANQGFGTGGPTGTSGIEFSKFDDPAVRKQVNKELSVTKGLYADINRDVQAQLDAAKSFVGESLGADAGAQFAKSLDLAQGYAQEISQIQVGLQTKQAAYSAQQFSVQINLAKRSLADAKGLVSGIGDNLGAIERQMFNLQREAQSLQMGQTQRQINFQQAIAGFSAPGLTGEERAARARQAKIEADFAQKQLNIQKELFGLQGKQFNTQANRNVTDLTAQLALLEKGRAITLDTAAAEKRIKALTVLQERENKKVETYYAAAVERTNDIIGLIFDIRAATGEAMAGVAKAVFDQMENFFKALPSIISGGPRVNASTGFDERRRNALGAVGTVNGETSFGDIGVAGEAGGEAFAILRDPKKLMSPLGGQSSGGTIQIIVQGNKFNTQEEQDELVRKLTYEVTQAQSRNLALTGLRSN
jgi:hypothetical protein